MTHDEAMELIREADRVCTLTYEETVMIYCRARQFCDDGEPVMGAAYTGGDIWFERGGDAMRRAMLAPSPSGQSQPQQSLHGGTR